MTPSQLQDRTLRFAVSAYRFAKPLFSEPDTRHIANQLVKAATSVAANYRAACVARSPAEWVAKIGLVREESDESRFWLIFIEAAGIAGDRKETLQPLTKESAELVRIFVAAYQTSKKNGRNRSM